MKSLRLVTEQGSLMQRLVGGMSLIQWQKWIEDGHLIVMDMIIL